MGCRSCLLDFLQYAFQGTISGEEFHVLLTMDPVAHIFASVCSVFGPAAGVGVSAQSALALSLVVFAGLGGVAVEEAPSLECAVVCLVLASASAPCVPGQAPGYGAPAASLAASVLLSAALLEPAVPVSAVGAL